MMTKADAVEFVDAQSIEWKLQAGRMWFEYSKDVTIDKSKMTQDIQSRLGSDEDMLNTFYINWNIFLEKMICFVEFSDDREDGTPEIYICTDCEYRNMGLMKEFFPWALNEYFKKRPEVNRLYSRINSENTASLLIHLKNGFSIESTTNHNENVIINLYKNKTS